MGRGNRRPKKEKKPEKKVKDPEIRLRVRLHLNCIDLL